MYKGRPINATVRKVDSLDVTSTPRERIRSQKTWIETIRNDLNALN